MGKSNSKTALKRKELEHLVNVTHCTPPAGSRLRTTFFRTHRRRRPLVRLVVLARRARRAATPPATVAR